ncbi:MAG: ATP-binding protein [bacterium]
MLSFRNISIKQKLIIIIILTSCVTLLVASIAFVAKDIITFRQSMVYDILSLAQVIGMNSSGALVFNDPETAEKNLSALSAKEHVPFACIYDKQGKIFATFYSQRVPKSFSPPQSPQEGHFFKNNYLYVFHHIWLEEEKIGTIFIQADLAEIRSRIEESAQIVTIIIFVSLLLAMLLSFFLQRIISTPILNLAQTAKIISQKKDYSVRARKQGHDEIGILIDGFNEMLSEIQRRDNELQRHREHLEEEVADRTAKLKGQQKILQEALDKAEQLTVKAEEANRVKSEFLANMSHEIRTPMNAILGFSDLLDSHIKDKKQKTYLKSIKSSGKNLLTLINDILDLSKIESGKMELHYEFLNPYSIFTEIERIFSLSISDKGIDFVLDIEPDIPESIFLDEIRLRQILFNLVGNAIKFTNTGHIKLSAKKQTHEDTTKKSIDLIIRVEDTGIGIPQESQNKIFEAFKQQDGQSTKKYGGTGLGLAISKRLVEMMGGKISVESNIKKGSCFTIVFREVSIGAPPLHHKEDEFFDYENIIFEKATMLLVEDIPLNRLLISEYLRSTNINIIEAEDGRQAIILSKRYKPDIILMDIKMPTIDGYEATHFIKENEELKNTPVIALTAVGLKEDDVKIIESGFDGMLIKPVQISDLFQELTRHLKFSYNKNEEASMMKSPKCRGNESLSPEIVGKLPEVIEELENGMQKSWKIARQSGLISNISEFGHQVKDIGERYSLEILQQFGDDLILQVQSCDIDKMCSTLNSFPKLISDIKILLEKK